MTNPQSNHILETRQALAGNAGSGALTLRGVTVERSHVRILDAVTIDFAPASLTCLVGPNGSGKTTLLRTAAGLIEPDSGDVEYSDRPLRSMTRRQIARDIGYVPQNTKPGFDFSVAELVTMGRYPHEPFWANRSRSVTAGCQERDGHDVVRESMALTDTLELADRSVHTLSGGELQRVLIARCLAAESRALLLDEPTAHLDLSHALELYELCRRLRSDGRTVVVAIHDLNAAMTLADEVIVLDAGRVVANGPPERVLDAERIRSVFGVDVSESPKDPPFRFELPSPD